MSLSIHDLRFTIYSSVPHRSEAQWTGPIRRPSQAVSHRLMVRARAVRRDDFELWRMMSMVRHLRRMPKIGRQRMRDRRIQRVRLGSLSAEFEGECFQVPSLFGRGHRTTERGNRQQGIRRRRRVTSPDRCLRLRPKARMSIVSASFGSTQQA